MTSTFPCSSLIAAALLLQAGAAAESPLPAAPSGAAPAAQADAPARSARSESRDKTAAPDPRAGAAVWRLSAGHILSTCGTGDITDLTVPALSASEAAALLGRDACASPLHEAAFQGRVDEVRRLLEAGADPHARSFTGETPLHLAALAGRADVVRLLLDKGADPRADSSRGTPLHRAAEGGAAEVVELLLNAGASVQAPATGDETPLHTAARMGQAEAARLLLESGADPNAGNAGGNTPLHLAAAFRSPATAALLLEHGAAVNARNRAGETPLLVVRDEETARLLLERGADPALRSAEGATPLHQAARAGLPELARVLIERGAKVNQKDDYGQTPLHCAAENACGAESCRIAALLLEHGADVNARAKYREPGRTALECAVLRGHIELVRLLLEHGADPNARDSCRNTPLHAAAAYKDTELAEMLLAAGADVNARNEDGDTPLSLAERAGATDTAALLRARGAKATSAAPRRTPNEAEDEGGNEAESGCGFARGESDETAEGEEPEEDVGEVLEAYPGARELYGTDSYAHLKQAVAVRVCWQWSREDTWIPLPSACVCLEGREARFFIDSLLRHAVYHPESSGRIIPVVESDDYYCDDACTDQFPTLIFYDAAGRPICWLDWIDFYPPLEGKYPNRFALPPSVFAALDALIIRRLPAAARPSEGRAKS
ncbi:MAG TPA: ankyrin repeat domain-containing protein [Candidatus Akkermansia intestinavium]|nr:ankyrin repeat domain-containing protein [Candidatus Akkermansia intestinavium]